MSAARGASYSAARIASRVAAVGREISRECKGRRLDVVVTLDRAFIFAADLVREIDAPVVCHFVREEVSDVDHEGHARREVFFGEHPELKGRDVLVVDAVLESGVTQEFLLRRLGEGRPRSIRLAVLLDKTAKRRVALEPDYFGFRNASNQMWVGYGLAAPNGTGRNMRQLSTGAKAAPRRSRRGRKK
ncbi:MAG TPA: phosphoribosyltransferase family protein [Candidatus Acidoferrum sp.]|nr:phosphoribosyltransferase family protein [Candidatus Acidoferrum sp.]